MPTPVLDVDTLEAITLKYFEELQKRDNKVRCQQIYLGDANHDHNGCEDYPELVDWAKKWGIREFTHPLLHLEVAYARAREDGSWPEEVSKGKRRTLAILVGTTFDPLLMAIWAYQPNRLVPVLNEYYGSASENHSAHKRWDAQWNEFKGLVKRLPPEATQHLNVLPDNDSLRPVKDRPDAVFEYLNDTLASDLADPDCEVIIDITGAKKTMVAGAYLFAAYTRAKISYVDFDTYDPSIGRPYGYSCRIDMDVSNPLRDLATDQWEAIAKAYDNYDFGLASYLLQSLPDEARVVLTDNRLDQLQTYLDTLKHWEHGDLHQARQLAGQIDKSLNIRDRLPSVIDDLGNYFGQIDRLKEWISYDVLTTPKPLVEHAHDELERAKWHAGLACGRGQSQKQPQTRQAFSKAYALYETLLTARVLKFMQKGGVSNIRFYEGTPDMTSVSSEPERRVALEKVMRRVERRHALGVLNNGQNQDIGYGRGRRRVREMYLTVDPEKWRHVQPLAQADRKLFDEFVSESDINNYRNLIIHTNVPVPLELAKNAIELAEASLTNYIERWSNYMKVSAGGLNGIKQEKKYTIVPWQEVKQSFGLSFVPEQTVENP